MIAMPCRLIPISAFLAILLLSGGCAGLKPLTPLAADRKAAVVEECGRPFLQKGYRLVHAMETVMPGGASGTAIGVMTADPGKGTFRTVFMTIEGMVLFDVEAGETLTVHRAVPPFDAPAFAGGLAQDIRLAFFHPGGEPAAWGAGEEGTPVCRFDRADGSLVEVRTAEAGEVSIRLYGAGQELRKRVTMARPKRPGLADTLEIRGGDWLTYTLRLRLLESEALDGDAGAGPGSALPAPGLPDTGEQYREGTKIP